MTFFGDMRKVLFKLTDLLSDRFFGITEHFGRLFLINGYIVNAFINKIAFAKTTRFTKFSNISEPITLIHNLKMKRDLTQIYNSLYSAERSCSSELIHDISLKSQ